MKKAALGRMENQAGLFTGTIRARSEEYCMVVADGAVFKSEKAAGCLLEPEAGDQVLVTRTEYGIVYVLSVLVRAQKDGLAQISAGSPMALTGQRLILDSGQALDLISPQFHLQTESALVRFKDASIVGRRLTTAIKAMKTVTDLLEVKAGRILQRAGRVYRRITQFEDVQVGRIRLLVNDFFHLKSKNTSINAEQRVRVDGRKIELG